MDVQSPVAVIWYGLIGMAAFIALALSVLWFRGSSWIHRIIKLCVAIAASAVAVYVVSKTTQMDNAAFVIINGCMGVMAFIAHTHYRDRLIDVLVNARKSEQDPPMVPLVANGAATFITALISWGFLFAVGMRLLGS